MVIAYKERLKLNQLEQAYYERVQLTLGGSGPFRSIEALRRS